LCIVEPILEETKTLFGRFAQSDAVEITVGADSHCGRRRKEIISARLVEGVRKDPAQTTLTGRSLVWNADVRKTRILKTRTR